MKKVGSENKSWKWRKKFEVKKNWKFKEKLEANKGKSEIKSWK